jgi:hypothetical protein
MNLFAGFSVSATQTGGPIPSHANAGQIVPGWVIEYYRGFGFTGTGLLWSLQLTVFEELEVGGEGRNRPLLIWQIREKAVTDFIC